MSILVVDDNPAISKLIRHNLEGNGIEVIVAVNGLECIRILHQSKVDLILLDIGLPDFSGWGILSLLRLTESLHDKPVIMVTVEPPDIALIEQFHPDDYIQKPFDISDLLSRIQKVMDSKNNSKILAHKAA